MSTIISIFAGFLSGLIGAMGFGGGGVLIIYLAVFMNMSQLKAQGINLLFFIPCAVVATIIYTIKKQVNYKEILPVISGGISGAIISSFLLNLINTHYLSKMFAVFLIATGIATILRLKTKKK
ncbi:MAG: sulfite exporter TauE/SafE family protein [Clostridia bacterium]|nr:sulfite exporter TauE/SafE family protein [Clostridia bacterium]